MYILEEKLKQEVKRLTQNNEELKVDLKILEKRIQHLTQLLLTTNKKS